MAGPRAVAAMAPSEADCGYATCEAVGYAPTFFPKISPECASRVVAETDFSDRTCAEVQLPKKLIFAQERSGSRGRNWLRFGLCVMGHWARGQ